MCDMVTSDAGCFKFAWGGLGRGFRRSAAGGGFSEPKSRKRRENCPPKRARRPMPRRWASGSPLPMYLIYSRRSRDTKERDTLSRVPLFGMPDWSRTSGLQSRSYQAVKRKCLYSCAFRCFCTNSFPFGQKRAIHCAPMDCSF